MKNKGEIINNWIKARKERNQTSKMVFFITVPRVDVNIYEDEQMRQVSEILKRNNVNHNFVDTIPGSWNLNRDWIETEEIESIVEYCGVYPVNWNMDDVVKLEELDGTGKIIILVYKVNKDGELIPNG